MGKKLMPNRSLWITSVTALLFSLFFGAFSVVGQSFVEKCIDFHGDKRVILQGEGDLAKLINEAAASVPVTVSMPDVNFEVQATGDLIISGDLHLDRDHFCVEVHGNGKALEVKGNSWVPVDLYMSNLFLGGAGYLKAAAGSLIWSVANVTGTLKVNGGTYLAIRDVDPEHFSVDHLVTADQNSFQGALFTENSTRYSNVPVRISTSSKYEACNWEMPEIGTRETSTNTLRGMLYSDDSVAYAFGLAVKKCEASQSSTYLPQIQR